MEKLFEQYIATTISGVLVRLSEDDMIVRTPAEVDPALLYEPQ